MLKARLGIHPTKRVKSGRTERGHDANSCHEPGGHRLGEWPNCAWVSANQASRGQAISGWRNAEATILAEEVFKNVQVLKGIPVDEFMETMGFFSASLGLNCTSCHGWKPPVT